MRFVNASENTSVTIPVKITVSDRRTAIHAKSPPTIAAVTVPIATPTARGQ
jgi:ribosomal protein L11